MRIVQIDDHFHPLAGYQINILSKYFVKFGHEVIIVCSEMEKMPSYLNDFFGTCNIRENDSEYEKNTGAKIIRLPIHAFISGRSIYTREIFRTIDNLNPDLLFIHSEDTAIAIQYLMRIEKKPYALLMDNHQCDQSSHNKFRNIFRWIYKKCCTPIIVRNQYKVVRLLENDYYMQEHFDIPIELCPYISFGSDTMLFHPDNETKKEFREKNKIDSNAFVVVYAGKLDKYKGGQLLADAIKKKFEIIEGREIVFLIVGNTSGEYGEKVEKTFAESENRVIRFPTQQYNDLAKFFQASDVGVIARENSLIFYDYQACGLPVISEDNEINTYRTQSNNGLNFKSKDVENFRKCIIEMYEMSESKMNQMKQDSYNFIKDGYDYEDKAREFEKLIISEIKRQDGKGKNRKDNNND